MKLNGKQFGCHTERVNLKHKESDLQKAKCYWYESKNKVYIVVVLETNNNLKLYAENWQSIEVSPSKYHRAVEQHYKL